MPNLVSVRGPHARGPMDNIRVQWNMGNSCNYECEYCPSILHDGSKPWLPLESYLTTIERLSQHYNDMGKRVDYELIGGEVTVIPGFEDIIRKISEYNTHNVVFTNGSRTVKWWSKAKHYMDGVVLTFHPDSQDKQHIIDVINEIKDHVTIDINIAGIGGQVQDLGDFVEKLRLLFLDCEHNRYDNVSICVKTMYKKLLGRHSKQETYWNYTDLELEVLQRPGIKPMPPVEPIEHIEENHEPTEHVEDTSWMTEFLYDDGTAKYVQSHQIINQRLNAFKGMKCHLGFESLNIDATGEMYSSWCGAVNFGNISNPNWSLPASEVSCPFDYCNNISDIAITKTA